MYTSTSTGTNTVYNFSFQGQVFQRGYSVQTNANPQLRLRYVLVLQHMKTMSVQLLTTKMIVWLKGEAWLDYCVVYQLLICSHLMPMELDCLRRINQSCVMRHAKRSLKMYGEITVNPITSIFIHPSYFLFSLQVQLAFFCFYCHHINLC
jgi:hypothetical protein